MVLLVTVVAIFGVSWGITSFIQHVDAKNDTVSAAPVSSAAVQSEAPAAADEPVETAPDSQQVDESLWNFPGPVEQTPEDMSLVAPDYRMIALPENGRVDMKYFDTVTFVGDSLTQGFQIYEQGIKNAHYCAYKGVGIYQMYNGSIQRRNDGTEEVPLEALVASQPDNVYILLGANAMVSMEDDDILTYYNEMLDAFQASLLPGVKFYIQSLTPVRPDNTPGFDMAHITALNNRLAQMAWQRGNYFVDLTEALAGDDGFLREDFAGGDGYHLSPSGYGAWVDYLVTHTAYDPKNPYLEGSEYYTQQPKPEDVAAAEAAAQAQAEADAAAAAQAEADAAAAAAAQQPA